MKPSPRNLIKNSPQSATSRAVRQRGAHVSAIEKQAREYADALLDISQELGLPLCATPAEIVTRVKEAAGHVGDLMEALNFLMEQTESDARAQAITPMSEAAGKEEAA
jgi:thymidine phosphorylase